MTHQPERTYPAISNWNTSLLLLRQLEEEASGQFGDLPIEEGFEEKEGSANKKFNSMFSKAIKEILDEEDGQIVIDKSYEKKGLKV